MVFEVYEKGKLERKINKEIHRTVKEKRTFINSINTRCRKMVAYPEELHNSYKRYDGRKEN